MKDVNKKRFALVKEYLAQSDRYTIEKFLRSKNLFVRPQMKGDGSVMLECPFHEDKNPSFSLDITKDIFRCFSCGAHGRFINFLQEYYASMGTGLTIYDIAEKILKQDSIMQKELGFRTIYRTSNLKSFDFDEEDLIIKKDYKFDGHPKVLSYRLLAKFMKSRPKSEQIRFIYYMQSSMELDTIRKEIGYYG